MKAEGEERMQGRGTIGGHYALGSWLGLSPLYREEGKEEDASCQWGRRGEIPQRPPV